MDPTDNGTRKEEDSVLNNTRRQFVAGSAGALGGLAAGAGFVGPSLAQEDGEDDEEDDEEADDGEDGDEPIENEFEDDVDILNYARTLELLEARFYQQGLENISEEEFCTCGVLSEDSPLAERVYGELETIQAHEESHAETLATVIEELGGEPVEEPEFDFGLAVEYPIAFLATAVQLEDVGVSAYAGAAPFIQNEDLIAPALGIHSVEARHAAFLRTLRDETSFPEVVDEPRSRSEVLGLIEGFIVDEEAEDGEDGEADDDETEDDEEDGIGDGTDDEGAGNGTDGTGDGVGNGTDGTGTDDGVGNDTDGTGAGDGVGNGTDGTGTDDGVGNDTDGTGTGNETSSIGL